MLWVGGGWVTLVLATVFARGVGDDEGGGGLVAPLRDHHRAAALPVVGDDLAVVVPEDIGGVEVEGAGLDDAGEVDGGTLLYVELWGPEDDGDRLDDSQVDPVLKVRRCRHLGDTIKLDFKIPQICWWVCC